MNLPRWIWIPFWGMARAVVEHSEICRLHKQAAERADYEEMNRLFKLSWSAMDVAIASIFIGWGEMVILAYLGAIVLILILLG